MVAGRAFAFADPRIIELAKTKFIPVTADDWYQRRRKDDEGVFFRSVADQGPRKGAGGSTRQGIYTFTADGALLEFKNAGQDADATYEQLTRALKKWNALPAARRTPGAVEVPAHGQLDANYSRTPLLGGAIIKVNARILDVKADVLVRGTCEFAGGMKASRDFVWFSAAEVKTLKPTKAEAGFSYPLPPAVARRLARFHLVDNTRGEPRFWQRSEVTDNALTLTVVDAQTLRLSGTVKLASAKGDRGYEAKLGGTLHFTGDVLDRFDVAAIGDHWGDDSVTDSPPRPGKSPLGIAFALADAKNPGERVSPQAARDWDVYIGKRDD